MTQLREELATADTDPETLALARALDDDLERLLDGDAEAPDESLMERARDAEARFAAEHPVAEGWLREIVQLLGRIGV